MNVIDSSAWLSWFADDDNAESFGPAIEDIDKLLVPSITISEVFKNILRQRGEDEAMVAIAHMRLGKVIPLDDTLAINAALYGTKLKLPLADSIIYATAQQFQALVWTQDADFDGLQGVRYFRKTKDDRA